MFIAFRVHTVVRIDRISWTDIQKPDKTVSGGAEGVATGILCACTVSKEHILPAIGADAPLPAGYVKEQGAGHLAPHVLRERTPSSMRTPASGRRSAR